MKKMILLVALVTIASVAIAQDINISMGLGVNFESLSLNEINIVLDRSVLQKTNRMGFNAIFDATYVVLGVEYSMSLADPSIRASVAGRRDEGLEASVEQSLADRRSSHLNLSLLAKYPVDRDAAWVFPLIGAEYSINLTGTRNDVYGLVGFGADVEIVDSIFIRHSFLFGWNFTKENAEGVDETLGWKFKSGVQVGYSF